MRRRPGARSPTGGQARYASVRSRFLLRAALLPIERRDGSLGAKVEVRDRNARATFHRISAWTM